MKVGNAPFNLPVLGFFALSFGIITPELDIKGVHGKGRVFLYAIRNYFNGHVLHTNKTVLLSFI